MNNRLIDKEVYRNLPKELKMLTDNFDDREKDIVLLSCLGVLSNCVPNIIGIYDGDTIYPHLYTLIVAPPASGKGVMNYSRALIEPIHKKILEDSRAEKLICENSKKKTKENKSEVCPNIQVKIVPANISTSELYSFLGNSKHGLLVMESEADTLSSMMNNDWSNYSDVLRKCFHHESLSIARKVENLYEEISEPKMSVLISGTPGQLKPFLKSRENGLFSRFIIYSFDELSEFKNVFAAKTNGNKLIFKDVANDVFELYGKLSKLEKPIVFEFSENQQKRFHKTLDFIWKDIVTNHTDAFIPNLNRHGLILFRIAMIISIIRNGNNLLNKGNIVCSNRDFLISLKLTQTILRHSQTIFDTMETTFLSAQDEGILDSLNPQFTRQEIIVQGELLLIPNRTIDDKLSQWQKKKIIKKISKGLYRKL
ncbi:DUF3987 domain-containing protein [Chryseobacterium sp. POL2]|uniref:DUF3987 domain-containing protein n=1 Tax=Chryseobacterium sp. POL2 TaxID=2713414 RepID=UPI0013E1AB25|nr:DUF3987 domain-containing protein [Chryseobacterium sp. POL2]QIG90659.1 DUF3987 domain-containing protein [Chryseobacterium sp. POL2]